MLKSVFALHITLFVILFVIPCGGHFVSTDALAAPPAKQTCVTSACHSGYSKVQYKHGPIEAKGCTVCHYLGEGGMRLPPDHPAIKPIDRKSINESCLVCHDEFGEKMAKKQFIHKATTKENCTGCHDAHGSNHKFLLKEKAAPDLCLTCHNKIQKAMGLSAAHHGPVTTGDACMTCHEVHASNLKNLLKKPEKELCLKCHSKELKTATGAVLANIQKALEEGKVHHKPIDDGECTACHATHGSAKPSLLKHEYDGEFYQEITEKSFDLCFSCHKPKLVEMSHVADETGFRNGQINLHYLHLRGQKKQRGCAACHAVHASRQPKLIADWVSFNDYQFPIKFQKVKDGGTCLTACHGAKTYDRIRGFKNAPGR